MKDGSSSIYPEEKSGSEAIEKPIETKIMGSLGIDNRTEGQCLQGIGDVVGSGETSDWWSLGGTIPLSGIELCP